MNAETLKIEGRRIDKARELEAKAATLREGVDQLSGTTAIILHKLMHNASSPDFEIKALGYIPQLRLRKLLDDELLRVIAETERELDAL